MALSLRGRDNAAVVSNSFPRLLVMVSGTEARVARGVVAAAFALVFAAAPFFLGGMTASVVRKCAVE